MSSNMVSGGGKLFGSLVSIEDGSGFFESAVLSLHDVEVTEDGLESNPADVHNVVLPANLVKSDGVDVLIEDECEGDREVEDIETLGTDVVGENLHCVRHDKGSEGDIVSGVEQEDECNDGMASSDESFLGVDGETDSLAREEHEHPDTRGHEEKSSSCFVDQGGCNQGDGQIPDLKDTVNE